MNNQPEQIPEENSDEDLRFHAETAMDDQPATTDSSEFNDAFNFEEFKKLPKTSAAVEPLLFFTGRGRGSPL